MSSTSMHCSADIVVYLTFLFRAAFVSVQTIPGLATRPGFVDIDLEITVSEDGEEHGRIVGLF